LIFTSQRGLVRLADLPVVSGGVEIARAPEAAPAESERAPARANEGVAEADVFAKLERVAELHAKGILNDAEFEAKKAELLARI